jgi:hypothetical protein
MDDFTNTKQPSHTTRERLGAVEMCPNPFQVAGRRRRGRFISTYLTYLQIHANTHTYRTYLQSKLQIHADTHIQNIHADTCRYTHIPEHTDTDQN